jgi:hypothetical protein
MFGFTVTARTPRFGLVCAALAAALVAPAAASAQSAPVVAPSQLAVVTARSGTLHGSVLALRGVSPTATWFLDRPYHQAGIDSTWTLLPAYFKPGAPAPNAAIEIASRRGKADTIVVELSHPAIDAKRRTLRFAAKVLPDAPDRMASWRTRRLAAPPRSFGRVSVFVDTASQSCTGDLALPAGIVAENPFSPSSYGSWPEFTPTLAAPGGEAFEQNGSFAEGCGGTVIYTLAQAGGGGGASGQLTLNWSNPEIGSNSASCSTTYPGLSCVVAGQSGDNPTWQYVLYG